jgi:hypothetical protein
LADTYELEQIIADLYQLDETLGNTTTPTLNKDLIQARVHDIVYRLRIWKENNYNKLREELNRWNKSQKLLEGED